MKSKGLIISLIVILSIVAFGLLIFMTTVLRGNFKFSNFIVHSKVSNELIMDEIYTIDFKKVDIKASTADIHIKTSADDTVRVVIYGEKEDTDVQIKENALYVKVKAQPCIGFCWNRTMAKIEIYLPKEYSNTMKIENDYGDIEVEEFLNATMDITEKCGDVSILGSKDVAVVNDYGDITVTSALRAVITERAGDVKIDTVQNATIHNNYGDIKINKVTNSFDIDNDCGDITIDDITLHENSTIKDSYGDIKLGKTNEIYIDAQTDLGDVKINNNYNQSDVILKIDNDCGDITVHN